MSRVATALSSETIAFAGELSSLLDQIGSASQIPFLSEVPDVPEITSVETLRTFLKYYYSEVLVPVELPAIKAGHAFALANQCREMIAFDQELGSNLRHGPFTHASKSVGCAYLKRLRPLKDNRFVQRYLQATDAGQAHGWHTLVYGLSLAIYSCPLRQGLLAYGQKTLSGLFDSAARRVSLSDDQARRLWSDFADQLPREVDRLVAPIVFTGQ